MNAHSRWLVRIGTFLVLLSPFIPHAVAAASNADWPVPRIFVPQFELGLVGAHGILHDIRYEMRNSWLPWLPLTIVASMPLLASFAAFRGSAWLRRINTAVLLLGLLALSAAGMSMEGDSKPPIPPVVMGVVPFLAACLVAATLLAKVDPERRGRAVRGLTCLLILAWGLLQWAVTSRGFLMFTGTPILLGGAMLMLAGELLARPQKLSETRQDAPAGPTPSA